MWLRQFPGGKPVWGKCEFLFDQDERHYDWFVVYNDLPPSDDWETLACRRGNTLLVTTEPPTIKSYGLGFTRQFGWVLTSQPEWSLPHPGRIYSQPALHWFYGFSEQSMLSVDRMIQHSQVKSRQISTVCSSKKQRHTLHNRRFSLTRTLQQRIPELEVYGHGVRPMKDKAEALDSYRYHLAIENYQGPHHWTEKLADPFLAQCLPIYFGCPNVADYFPEESFVLLDLFDPDGAVETINKTMRDNEYEKRRPYILEARRRVIKDYNLFAVLAKLIPQRHDWAAGFDRGGEIYSRRRLRKENPVVAVRDLVEKNRVRLISLAVGTSRRKGH